MNQEEFEGTFDEKFFDARRHKQLPGQVMAKFTAVAYLDDGRLKRDLIDLLKMPDKARAAARVMQVLGGAIEGDSYRVCKEIASDLLGGLTDDEVAVNLYRFTYEQVFWANREAIPESPHWSVVPIWDSATPAIRENSAGEKAILTDCID